jgi:hypothetical protein
MAVLTLESAGRVRQKTRAITRNPGVFAALKSLFLHLAANKGNPDLEIKFSSGAANTALVDNPCKLYCVYLKKGTNATAAFFKLSNHATVVQASAEVILHSATAGEVIFAIWPDGKAFTTGIAAGSYTAYSGTDTTTASTATHELSGFFIVGAAA